MRHGWNSRTLILLAILIVFNIAQCASLVKRAPRGTDFTVFYNTGQLLDRGAGAELYRGKDQSTEWLRTIPPFGQALIHPFGQGSLRAAAIGWGVFNLILLGASAWTLRFFIARLSAKRRVWRAVWPHCVLLLLALSPASLQVGQFSVLFVACWIFYLGLIASRGRAWAGALLALPVAVKIYPLVLLAVPFLARRPRVGAISLVWVALFCAAPFMLYGARAQQLSTSFWSNAIASSGGRVAEAQRASSPANQGLDSVALRYLTSGQPIQKRFPQLPHLNWPRASVVRGVNWARGAVLLLSLGVGWAFWRRGQRAPLWGQAMLLALLCAALHVILPGAKTRYAIHAFPAFWPLLCCAFAARRLGQKRAFWSWSVVIVALCVAVGLTPAPLRVWGIGWLGALVLWALNLTLLWRWSRLHRFWASKSPVTNAI